MKQKLVLLLSGVGLLVLFQNCSSSNQFSADGESTLSSESAKDVGLPPQRVPSAGAVAPSSEESALMPNTSSCLIEGNRKTGEHACFGNWELGNVFGADYGMCALEGESRYEVPHMRTGCTLKATVCASGQAVAVDLYRNPNLSQTQGFDNIHLRDGTEEDLALFAEEYEVSVSYAKEEMIVAWKYVCL